MSDYTYSRRSGRTRDWEPEYVEETTYVRGSSRPNTTTEIVYRGRRDDDDVEEITRDFPPSSDYPRSSYRDDYYPPRRARSERRRDDYYDDYYSEAGYTAAGAGAGYAASRRDGGRSSRYRDDGYYSERDDRSERSPPRRERRKSKVEEALEGVGLGALARAVTGDKSHDGKSRRGSSSSSSSNGRSSRRSKSQEARRKWQQAAKAAVTAGVIQAIVSRKEPGGWTGPKGQRALTAALGAAGIDGFLDRDPEEKKKRHIIESVVGGLAVNRVANGPERKDAFPSRGRSMSRGRSASRDPSQSRTGLNLRSRSRSLFSGRGRSQSRGRSQDRDIYGDGQQDQQKRSSSRGLKQVAAAGGLAAVGKAIYDRVRSKSRGRQRSRSAGSEDSYVPTRRQQYQESRGAGPDNSQDTRVGRPRGRGDSRDGEGKRGKSRSSSSSSISTEDLENQRKKNFRKELLTAGLATVATIHAAHGVYSSMVASEKRHKLVMEGEMSQEEARKRKSKNMLQDAAAIGIAALGIKSAFSEWKEMNEQRHSVQELEARRRKHRKARERREKERQQRQQEMPFGMNAYPGAGAYPPPLSYADGNPYASGGLPPPPVGGQESRYAPQYA